MTTTLTRLALSTILSCTAVAASAQEAGDSETTPPSYEGSVFDGDWVSVGAGAV